MAEEYLVRVKTLFDTASLREYVKESVEGIKRIAAEAARAQSAPQRQVAQEQFQAQQASTGATLAAARDSGVIPNADLERAAKTLAVQFDRQAKAGNIQLAKTEQLTAAIDSELAQRRRLATAPAYELNNDQFKERYRVEQRQLLTEDLERLKRTTRAEATKPLVPGGGAPARPYAGPEGTAFRTKADAERAYGAALKANTATDLPKADQAHQLAITRALAAGVPVSEKVLADYQGLESTVKARIHSEDAAHDAAIRTATQAEASAKAGQELPAKIARLEAELDKATTAYKRVAEAAQSAPQAHFDVAAAQLRQTRAAESLSGARAQLGRSSATGQGELFDPASAKLTNPHEAARNAARVELARIEAQEQALLGVRARLLGEANAKLRAANEDAESYNADVKRFNRGKLKRDQERREPLSTLKDFITPGEFDEQRARAGHPTLASQYQANERALSDLTLRSPQERAGSHRRTERERAVDALNLADQRLLTQLNAQADAAPRRFETVSNGFGGTTTRRAGSGDPLTARLASEREARQASAQVAGGSQIEALTAEHAKQVVAAASNAALEQRITVQLGVLEERIIRETASFKSGITTLSGRAGGGARATTTDPAGLLEDLKRSPGLYYEGSSKAVGKSNRHLSAKVQNAVDENRSRILLEQGEAYSDPRVQDTARERARIENYYRGGVAGTNEVSLKNIGYSQAEIARVNADVAANKQRQEARRQSAANPTPEGSTGIFHCPECSFQGPDLNRASHLDAHKQLRATEERRAAKARAEVEAAPAVASAGTVSERGARAATPALEATAKASAATTAVAEESAKVLAVEREWHGAIAGIPAQAHRKAELFTQLIGVQESILAHDKKWAAAVEPIPALAERKAALFRQLINAQELILSADKRTLESADATAHRASNAAGTHPIVVPAGTAAEDEVFAAQSRREQAKRHELTEAGGRPAGQARPGQDRVIFPLGDGAYGEVDAADIAQKKRVRIAKGLADAGAPAQGQDESDVAAQGRLRNARIIALNNAIVADTEGLRDATAATQARTKAERSATHALNQLNEATTEELRELAEARVLGHRQRGQVSSVISGDPTLVKDEVTANVQNRHLKSQINTGTISAESRKIADGDEAALHQLNQRIISASAERVRKLVERGAAEDLILKETRTLGELVQQENLRHYEYLKYANLLVTEAKADAQAVKDKAKADARAAKEAEKAAAVAAEQSRLAALPATRFQRFQQGIGSRTTQERDRPAASYSTFGQAIGSGLVTAARFAISGAILYQGVSTIKSLITASNELDLIFEKLQSQLVAVGKGDQFEGLKKQVFSIAQSTGAPTKDVGAAASAAQGAFGGQGSARVGIETENIVKLSKVAKISIEQAANDGIAASKAFGVSISTVTDAAVGNLHRTGAPIAETTKALATVGPVAKSIGLNLNDMNAILGVLQQTSTKTGSSLGDLFNRLGPAIQSVGPKLVDILKTNPATAGAIPQLTKDIQTGNTGQVLKDLIPLWDKLTDVQKHNLEVALGGSRGAQAVIAVLTNGKKVLDDIAAGEHDAGLAAARFAAEQKTLGNQIERFKQVLVDVGLQIYKAGLEDALKKIVQAGGFVLSVVLQLVKVFADFNSATGGLVVKLGELYLLLKAIDALKGLKGAGGLLGGLTGGVGRKAAVQTLERDANGLIGFAQAAAPTVGSGIIGGAGARFAAGRAASVAAGAAGLESGIAGGLAAVGGIGVPIAGAAVFAAFKVREAELKNNKKQAAAFNKKLDEATIEKLQEVVKERGSLLDQVREKAERFLGFSTAEQSIKDALGRKTLESAAGGKFGAGADALKVSDEIQAAQDAHIITGRHQPGLRQKLIGGLAKPESADEVATKALKGDEEALKHAQEDIEKLRRGGDQTLGGGFIGSSKGGPRPLSKKDQGKLDAFNANLDKAQKAVAADRAALAAQTQEDLVEVGNIKAQYDAGQLSLGELYAAYKKADQDLADKIDAATDPKVRSQLQGQRDSNSKSEAAARSATARGIADLNVEKVDLAGGDVARAKIDEYSKLLEDPVLDPAEAKKAVTDLNAALREELTQQADQAESGAERLAILRAGIKVPEPAQIAKLRAEIKAYDKDFYDFITAATATAQEATDLLEQAVAKAVHDGITVANALRSLLKVKIDNLKKEISDYISAHPGGDAHLGDLLGSLILLENADTKPIPESKFSPTKDVKATPTQLTSAKKQADNEAAAAESKRKSAADKAESEARAAAERAHVEAEAVARAKLALEKALHEGDPVAVAQAAVDEANLALSLATKDSERINAQAQLVLAQHALIRARGEISDAYLNLDKAQASATGDVIRVADDEIKAAQLHLDNARERGNLLETLAAEAALTGANANKISTQIGKGTKDVDTGLALERISTAEAIAELELLQHIPGETKDQYDQLQIKINALRKSASADLQFDIPSEIKLPTLYEVRRLRQTESQGGGSYQDNRQVAVQYNVFTPQDNQTALGDLVGVMSGSPRVGATPRTYP